MSEYTTFCSQTIIW